MTSPLANKHELQARLERLRREVRNATRFAVPVVVRPTHNGSTYTPRAHLIRASMFAAKAAVVIVLPFTILVGGSVWLYGTVGVPTWLALLFGIGATGGVVAWYVGCLSHSLRTPMGFKFIALRIALPLVLAYCTYSLVYLSRVNAKSDEVRQYYTAMHPLLRVAITTATVFDRELVVTDMARAPEDYDRMGLPRLENSLHFEQRDGFVHAVDLRTMRRAEWRNLLMRGYFVLMGFRTLRHVGTADHLHVSLPPRRS